MGRSGVYQEKTEKKELSPIATRISDMNMVTFLFVECAIIIILSVSFNIFVWWTGDYKRKKWLFAWLTFINVIAIAGTIITYFMGK